MGFLSLGSVLRLYLGHWPFWETHCRVAKDMWTAAYKTCVSRGYMAILRSEYFFPDQLFFGFGIDGIVSVNLHI